MEWWQITLYFVALIFGWFLSYYVGPKFMQEFALRRELIANYLLPFKAWCRVLCMELTEFKERYKGKQVYKTLSKTLVIIDYRQLHDVLRECGQYRDVIKKDNPDAAIYLEGLEYLVDNLWHGLQDEFRVNFDQSEHNLWMAEIIDYAEKGELVDVIEDKSGEILDYLSKKKKEFENLTSYLDKQIPKW